MNGVKEAAFMYIENSGWLAPLLFILFHVFRQFLFVPVAVVCIVGGYLFGVIYGTVFSLIGLTLMSFVFYVVVHKFPSWVDRLSKVRKRWMKDDEKLNIGQIMILRMMPFVHFHFVSLYLIESTKHVREYMKLSFLACVPPALMYTSFGHIVADLSLYATAMMLIVLASIFYILGRKDLYEKVSKKFVNRSM